MVTLTYQERFRTAKGVFDAFTNKTLYELQKRGVFDELLSPLSIGKESNVFIAKKGSKKVIVKIFRMQNAEFMKMYDYIRKDPRYEFLRNHRRQIILAWAQREYKNLLKCEKGKIRVPKTIGWRNHIIVEEMIGEPALPLKDAEPEDPKAFFDEVVNQMKKMYKIGLIHGDLSSFNILNFDGVPVLIDFSQGTIIRTPNSEELLVRDIKNVVQYFNKIGLKINVDEVFKKVTGK